MKRLVRHQLTITLVVAAAVLTLGVDEGLAAARSAPDPRLVVSVRDSDARVRARVEQYCFTDRKLACGERPRRLTLHERLRVRPGATLTVVLRTPASNVTLSLIRPDDFLVVPFQGAGALVARRAGASGRRWRLTLPRRIPARVDRLRIDITYTSGDAHAEDGADFQAALRIVCHGR